MRKNKLTIATISGSLRKNSYNQKLIEVIKAESKEDWNMSSIEIGTLPLFNEDLETNGDPEEVKKFKESLKGVDGILLVTPEYNSGIPGGLKNALDWGSRPAKMSAFAGMPVAVAGATPGGIGTALAQSQLRQVLVAMNANVMSSPKVLVGEVHKKIDAESGQIVDPRTVQHLQSFIGAFTQYVEMYKSETE